MSWLASKNDNDTAKNSSLFWEKLKSDLQEGQFWADAIKNYRGEPAKRLSMAMENFPLPGAFKEAAIAIRGLIKEKKKNNESYSNELTMLYWVAAINSLSIPSSSYLQQPGFNVMEAIPGSVINALQFSYYELGYEELKLLNKTDVKLIIKEWGEPKVHSTLNNIYSSLWHEYEKKVKANQEQKLKELLSRVR